MPLKYALNNEFFIERQFFFCTTHLSFGSVFREKSGKSHPIFWRKRDAGSTLIQCPGFQGILDRQIPSSVLLATDWEPVLIQTNN